MKFDLHKQFFFEKGQNVSVVESNCYIRDSI